MPAFTETLPVPGQPMALYVSVPEGSGPFPAVLISPHATGVDDFIKAMCDRLAGEGYAAVAPDLFHRTTEAQAQAADKTRRQLLNDVEIIADMNAAIDFLQQHPAINGDRIGITGFCMGGRVSWLVAAVNPAIRAAVPYYPGNTLEIWGRGDQTPFALSQGINCPVLGHFGEIDVNPSPEDLRKLDAELTRLGKPHQFYNYPNTDHGFMDFTRPRYNRAAAEMSWPRTLEFFERHLKG